MHYNTPNALLAPQVLKECTCSTSNFARRGADLGSLEQGGWEQFWGLVMHYTVSISLGWHMVDASLIQELSNAASTA